MEQKSLQVIDGKMQITTIDEAYRQAVLYSKSGLLPASFDTPEKVMVCIQYANELKIPPLIAMKHMYVVKGTPALFGDLPLSMVMQSGNLEYIKETQLDANGAEIKSGNNNLGADCEMALCKVKRKGFDETERSYSWAEAKRAGLDKDKYGDKDTWKKHRRRMLQMRARSWALKDIFPDVLMGVAIKEYDDYNDETEKTKEVKTIFEVENPSEITVDIRDSKSHKHPLDARIALLSVEESAESIETKLEKSETDDSLQNTKIELIVQANEIHHDINTGRNVSVDGFELNQDVLIKDQTNMPDQQGFIQDVEKPFIKTKAKTLNETLKDRAGDVQINCWKKFEGSKVRDIPEDELLTMLANLDMKIKTKVTMPPEWELFYSSACTYLNRKQES